MTADFGPYSPAVPLPPVPAGASLGELQAAAAQYKLDQETQLQARVGVLEQEVAAHRAQAAGHESRIGELEHALADFTQLFDQIKSSGAVDGVLRMLGIRL